MIESLSIGKCSMYIDIAGWHTFMFGHLMPLIVTRWCRLCRWHSMWSWCHFGWKCICSFEPPMCLWVVCCAIWQRRQPSVKVSRTIVGCLSITTFTLLGPGNTTLHFFSSVTSVWGFLMRHCVSSIVAHKNPTLAILAIFKARGMLDWSSCTWPLCLAIVADMLTTYKKSVVTSKYEIGNYLNNLCFLGLHWGWLKPVSSTLSDSHLEIHLQGSKRSQHHDVWFRGLCRQMPWLTMGVSNYGQGYSGNVALFIHPLYSMFLIDGHLPRYRVTHIRWHDASYCCSFWFDLLIFNLHPGWYLKWLRWQHCSGLTGVYDVAVSWRVVHWLKYLLFD